MNCFILILVNFFTLLYPAPKEFICLYTKNPVLIDGRLDEWGNAKSIFIADTRKETDNTAIIKTLWDKKYLYIAFEVRDKNLQAKQYVLDHPQLYLDDMVEFLFDTHNQKDSCWNVDDVIYHINLLGQKKDDRGSSGCITNPTWNGSAKYVIHMDGTLNDTTDIDIGFNIEIAISWEELEVKPFPGFKMGADFADGDYGKLFDWVGAMPFRSPYAFGNLILQKNKK